MLELIAAHKILILSVLLGVSEIVGLASKQIGAGGILDMVIKGLKLLGAKDPEA